MLGNILFYIFSGIMCVSALLSILNRNSVHAVLYLILMFFASAWIMLLLNAEFLALLLIIVYVGAVAVLFLFVVMMLNTYYKPNTKKIHYITSSCVAFVLFFQIFNLLTLNSIKPNVISTIPMLSISKLLYIENFINFQIAGVILLIGMVAVILLKDNKSIKTVPHQNLDISSKDCVEIKYPPQGEGITL